MPKKYFIDSNVFLRVLVRDNEEMFQKSYSFLESVKNGEKKACTSSFVIAEVQWVLSNFYKFPKEKSIAAISGILALSHLKILSDHSIQLAVELYKNNAIKFVDTILASHTFFTQKNAVMLSYDKEFDKIKIKREEP
jgi:predicted nucleic-acid-binding protein